MSRPINIPLCLLKTVIDFLNTFKVCKKKYWYFLYIAKKITILTFFIYFIMKGLLDYSGSI